MSDNTFKDKDFINELSKKLVVEFAPEEIDMFDELAKEYYENPGPPDKSNQADDPLGLGLDLALSVVTPVALTMATAVLNFVMKSTLDAVKNETSERIQGQVKRLFSGIDDKDNNESELRIQIKPEEIKTLRRIAIQEAQKFGYIEGAEQMADELIRPLMINL